MIAALPMYLRPEYRAAHDACWDLIRDGLRARGMHAITPAEPARHAALPVPPAPPE